MVISVIDKDNITTVERRNNEELRDLYVTSRLGQALEIKTLIENTTLSRQEYTYDRGNSNLSSRLIQINGGNVNKEEFEYDALDRLSSVKLNSSSIYSLKMSYDSKGNITGKTDISGKQMSYHDPNRPHAITGIVADDPLTYLSNQNIQYTFFDQPKIIQTGQNTLSFKYGSNNQRKLVESDSPWIESGSLTHRKYYFRSAELLISPSGEQTLLKYITANGKLVAIVRKTEETQEIFYPILDRQGSIIAILNSDNEFVETRSYDAWGRLRNSEDWTDYQDVSLAITSRSYTGHEYLPDHKLINMNGRLYDPQLGRMLSPDMYVQNPGNSQNYNRYSYVLNNPLKYTDPSGELCQGCDGGSGLLLNGPGSLGPTMQEMMADLYEPDWDVNELVGGGNGSPRGRDGVNADGTMRSHEQDFKELLENGNVSDMQIIAWANTSGYNWDFEIYVHYTTNKANGVETSGFDKWYSIEYEDGTSYDNRRGIEERESVRREGSSWASSIQGGLMAGELVRQAKGYQFFGSSAQASDDALKAGKYIHKGQVYWQGNYSGVTNSMKNSLSTAKVVKATGRTLGVLSAGVTLYQAGSDFKDGRYKSGSARLAVGAFATGAAILIPGIGWGVAIGIGVADAIWGDDFYNMLENL